MGMYTELYLGVRLKEDVPKEVISTLQCMVNLEQQLNWPKHPFFEKSRSFGCFHCGSYYFDAVPMCQLKYEATCNFWSLTFVANIKNYEGEWESFIDWLIPYIETGSESLEHIGHCRYENQDYPTILMSDRGKVLWVDFK